MSSNQRDTITGSDVDESMFLSDVDPLQHPDTADLPGEKVLLRDVRNQLTDVFRASFLRRGNTLPEGILETNCVHELILRLSERYVTAQTEGRDPMIALSGLLSEIAEDRQGILTNALLRYAHMVAERDGMYLDVATDSRTTIVSTNKKAEYSFLKVSKSDIQNFLKDVVNRIHGNGFRHRVDFEAIVHDSFDEMFDTLDQRLSPKAA